ncbi:MAG: DNA translocase FtsK 4TM domain-containing protein [Paludibacteraceae bacterium]|nr:DNA translocase FtsK 4TM domain-containing protein [Paludibacteraceae bacterium]
MPRTSSKSQSIADERPAERAIRVEKTNTWEAIQRFFQARETRMVVGILLLTFALIATLAYVSFLFTGTSDQSILSLDRPDRLANRESIRNLLGLPGARLAQFMIDGSFGFVSILLAFMVGIYALRLMHVIKELKAVKLFCCTVFWVLWGSVVLGFAQQMVHLGLFQWGGAFGAWAAKELSSYVNTTGTTLILIAALVIFLIVTDPRFIDRCRAFGQWVAGLFKRKPKPDQPDQPEDPNVPTDVVIDLPVDTETTQTTPTTNDHRPTTDDDITLTIEPITSEDDDPLPEEPLDEPLGDEPLPPDDLPPVKDEPKEDSPDLAIEDVIPDELYTKDPDAILAKLGPYDPRKDLEFYKFPSLNLLKVYDNEAAPVIDEEEQRANGARIVTTLCNYGIEIDSIKATVGPTVTLYEIVPKAGIRVAQIQRLENDIMLSLSATGIRIIAPMPGKGTIGIEVPNEKPQVVSMHSVIASKRFQDEQKMRLPVAYGRTITNEVFMFDLAKTPHLLVAGATGTGKSVAINAIITSLLYKKHPAELKLVMVDPKMVEFAPYKPLLKHFLAAQPDTDPDQIVITDCDRVINTLNSLVIEMENRYKLLMDAGVRNLEDYNDKFVRRRLNPNKLVADSLHHQFLPYIVIIIDEYGDFIMQAGKQVETPIARITQKARAVGMHMILATQRPSVNIVTGVIKANIPTRIALRTQSVIDSRTVLDAKGAEQLIGRGDSLYAGNASITRVQCAFVDTPEVDEIVKHISKQQRYTEPYQLPEYVGEGGESDALAPGSVDMKRLDPMFADVARYVVTKQEGSTSRLQRAFEIGYNRAGKLSDQLEAAGVVGPNKGPKGRDVLITDLDQLDKLLEELGVK